jgi:feruloyl esterase
MIVWHGWSDPLPNPVDTIDYYNRIRTGFGHSRSQVDKTEEFVRLFLLPNVGHCGGGAAGGPNTLDQLTALEEWVEEGIAPDEIVASRVTDDRVVTRTRPICAYPQVARYVGSGSIDDAANFVCELKGARPR